MRATKFCRVFLPDVVFLHEFPQRFLLNTCNLYLAPVLAACIVLLAKVEGNKYYFIKFLEQVT